MPRNTKVVIPDCCLQKESMQEQDGLFTVFTYTILFNNVVHVKQLEKGLFQSSTGCPASVQYMQK